MVIPASSPRVYRRRRQRMRRLLFFLFFVVALFSFIHSGFFSLKNIEFSGNVHIADQELENLMGVARGINLWQVDTNVLAQRLATHPLVARADVSRRWPRTLIVHIEERTAAAIVLQEGKFLLIDGGGVVMEITSHIGNLELPLLSGLGKLENIGPGKEINHPGLQAALTVLRQMPAEELPRIQEIIASSPDNLQLIWTGNIPVKFGDARDVAGKLARLHEAMQGLAGRGTVEYIDVSFAGAPVVKFKQDNKREDKK